MVLNGALFFLPVMKPGSDDNVLEIGLAKRCASDQEMCVLESSWSLSFCPWGGEHHSTRQEYSHHS